VIIVLLLMILAMMDFGQFLFFHQALTDRARVGARYAIANTFDVTAIKNVVLFSQPTDPGTPAMFGLTTSQVTVTRPPAACAINRIEVQIAGFPIVFLSPFMTKSHTHRPIRAIRQAEGLGATN
jgi:hypothetical protein